MVKKNKQTRPNSSSKGQAVHNNKQRKIQKSDLVIKKGNTQLIDRQKQHKFSKNSSNNNKNSKIMNNIHQVNKQKFQHKSLEQKQQNKVDGASKNIDQRFEKASYDPKFLKPKQAQIKTKIDSRFNKMLTDPKFSLGGEGTSKVDKYGRRIISDSNGSGQLKENKQNRELKQFYQLQDEEMLLVNHKIKRKKLKIDHSKQQTNDFQEDSEDVRLQQQDMNMQKQQELEQEDMQDEEIEDENDRLRKWMEQYAEESSQSLSQMPIQQIMEEQNEGPEVWSESEQHVVKNEKVEATRRLALCNYDWMNINAKDLMILFSSFKPASGYIKSIKVFQSLLGKQKMENQETFGPQGIWKDQQEDDFAQQQNTDKKWRRSWAHILKRQENNALDEKRLRAYEKERLKYFYAVIECDSKKTADQIYKQCDGNQFQHSNLQFDLRFIPDDVSFDKNLLKEECDQLPIKGEVKNFVNRVVGHSKVQLTWQDPELSLPATLKKKNWGKMTDQQLDKIDWATYLNQGDIDEEDQQRELILQNEDKNFLPDWKKQCNKKYRQKQNNQQLVISFEGGFNSAKSNITSKASEQNVFPSLKQQNKHKKSQKQLRKRAQEERKKKRQQLQLIAQNPEQQVKEKSFKVDLQDSRFKAVFNNPAFSIDPTDPKFDHRKSGEVFKKLVDKNKSKGFK